MTILEMMYSGWMYYRVVSVMTHGQVLARFGHALSDPTRARVLLALREAPAYPAELADLLGVSRQSLSNHLACLRGCGLVVAVPEGRRGGTSWPTRGWGTRWVICSAWCWRSTRRTAPRRRPGMLLMPSRHRRR